MVQWTQWQGEVLITLRLANNAAFQRYLSRAEVSNQRENQKIRSCGEITGAHGFGQVCANGSRARIHISGGMIRGDPAFREDFKQQLPARPSHRVGEQPPSPGTRGLFGGVGTTSPCSRHRLAACLCASKASAGQECGCRPASKPLAAGLQDSECRPVGGTGQTWSLSPHLEHEQKGVLSLLLRQLAKPVRFNQSPTK